MNHEDHPISGAPEYTCPMHLQIIREEPGFCPICGMALEPREATGEDVNPELRDMTLRFWTSVALTVPTLAFMIAVRGRRSPGGFSLRWRRPSCSGRKRTYTARRVETIGAWVGGQHVRD